MSGSDLTGANLTDHVDLGGANLFGANLSGADLTGADLSGADLCDAFLYSTNLSGANLTGAKLKGARLSAANFAQAHLLGADLTEANLEAVNFGGTDLKNAVGLDSCHHFAPSFLDYHTLVQSGPLPLSFLRGCGLSDQFIEYLPSLLRQAIQFYSCFISYSTKDKEFAERLYADLQNKGVRCWYAAEDLKIGDKFQDRIEESIRWHDKLLLVLSKNSIDSPWVEDEVQSALEKERKERKLVLFPVRLDEAVMDTSKT